MKKFEDEMAALRERLAEMGVLTQSMVAAAADGIRDPNQDRHPEIELWEEQLNSLHTDIDREAVRLLTVYSPVATQLRFVLVVTHVSSQFERIGDQVVNVSESLRLMQADPRQRLLPGLGKMADDVRQMVNDAAAAFLDGDADKAEAIRRFDDVVDAAHDQIIQQLLSDDHLSKLDGSRDIADVVSQILVSRHLERIADQAVNICKEIIYVVRGEDVRHARPHDDASAAEGSAKS